MKCRRKVQRRRHQNSEQLLLHVAGHSLQRGCGKSRASATLETLLLKAVQKRLEPYNLFIADGRLFEGVQLIETITILMRTQLPLLNLITDVPASVKFFRQFSVASDNLDGNSLPIAQKGSTGTGITITSCAAS